MVKVVKDVFLIGDTYVWNLDMGGDVNSSTAEKTWSIPRAESSPRN
jgi:hypothetical protein